MKYKSILIITYGRSGSTLLQGILNTIPSCIIRGENYNFVFDLYNAYKKIKKAKNMELPSADNFNRPSHSWYGANNLNEEVYLSAQKSLLKNMLIAETDNIFYGFKEIRYFNINVFNELEDYLNFMELIMDDVAFVFNTRNPKDVANSSWWKKYDSSVLIPRLEKANKKFEEISQKRKNAFIISYENIVNNIDAKKNLFKFLAVEYNQEEIDSILNKKHSQDNKKVI